MEWRPEKFEIWCKQTSKVTTFLVAMNCGTVNMCSISLLSGVNKGPGNVIFLPHNILEARQHSLRSTNYNRALKDTNSINAGLTEQSVYCLHTQFTHYSAQ